MLEEYDLSSIDRRRKADKDDRKFESFNISKELDKVRAKQQDKKDRKRSGY